MKIHAIKTYQAVSFQGKMHNYFTEALNLGLLDIELSTFESIGVQIKTPKDTIVVPYANIAAILPIGGYENKKFVQKQEESVNKSQTEVRKEVALAGQKDDMRRRIDAANEERRLAKEVHKAAMEKEKSAVRAELEREANRAARASSEVEDQDLSLEEELTSNLD